jgi:hypothetical protein
MPEPRDAGGRGCRRLRSLLAANQWIAKASAVVAADPEESESPFTPHRVAARLEWGKALPSRGRENVEFRKTEGTRWAPWPPPRIIGTEGLERYEEASGERGGQGGNSAETGRQPRLPRSRRPRGVHAGAWVDVEGASVSGGIGRRLWRWPLAGIPTHVQTLGAVRGSSDRREAEGPARGSTRPESLDFESFFEDMYEGLFQALVLTCGEFRAYARAPGQ